MSICRLGVERLGCVVASLHEWLGWVWSCCRGWVGITAVARAVYGAVPIGLPGSYWTLWVPAGSFGSFAEVMWQGTAGMCGMGGFLLVWRCWMGFSLVLTGGHGFGAWLLGVCPRAGHTQAWVSGGPQDERWTVFLGWRWQQREDTRQAWRLSVGSSVQVVFCSFSAFTGKSPRIFSSW